MNFLLKYRLSCQTSLKKAIQPHSFAGIQRVTLHKALKRILIRAHLTNNNYYKQLLVIIVVKQLESSSCSCQEKKLKIN